MVNKIDTERLGKHIGELNSLYQEWNGYSKKVGDIGENSGGAVNQMTEIAKSLELIQDGFISLLNNTISYMNKRKESVERKESLAAKNISK